MAESATLEAPERGLLGNFIQVSQRNLPSSIKVDTTPLPELKAQGCLEPGKTAGGRLREAASKAACHDKPPQHDFSLRGYMKPLSGTAKSSRNVALELPSGTAIRDYHPGLPSKTAIQNRHPTRYTIPNTSQQQHSSSQPASQPASHPPIRAKSSKTPLPFRLRSRHFGHSHPFWSSRLLGEKPSQDMKGGGRGKHMLYQKCPGWVVWCKPATSQVFFHFALNGRSAWPLL